MSLNNNKFSSIFLLLFFVSFFPSLGVSLEIPKEPAIKNVKQSSSKKIVRTVDIFMTGGEKFNGRISFFKNKFYVSNKNKNITNKREFEIKNLKSYIVKSWVPSKKRKKTYVFYPNLIEFSFVDGSRIIGKDFNGVFFKLKLNSGKKNIIKFSYFYDYYTDGNWENSKNKDFDFPNLNPLVGVVNKIEFHKDTILQNSSDKSKLEGVTNLLKLLKGTGKR